MKEKFVIVLVMVTIFSAGFVAIAASRLETGSGIQADTTTHGRDITCGDWLAEYRVMGGGRFPSPPGTGDKDANGNARGEIFDRTVAYYSWFHDGSSQAIVGQAVQRPCGDLVVPRYGAMGGYVFSINNQDGNWVRFYQDRIPKGQLGPWGTPNDYTRFGTNYPAFSFEIDGFEFCQVETGSGCPGGKSISIKDGAILKVEAFVAYNPSHPDEIGNPEGANFPGNTGGWTLLSTDQMTLRSALAQVSWQKAAYKIGENAVVQWEIPVTTYQTPGAEGQPGSNQTAYFLTVTDCNTNQALADFSRRPLTTLTGSYSIPVVGSYFSNDLATCQNRLRAAIYSSLVRVDQEDTAVQAPFDAVLGIGNPPTVLEVTFDKKEAFEGDTIVVSWKATGNITKYHITVHIGGLSILDKDLAGGEKSVSLVAPTTGILEAEVTAYDRCQPSAVKKSLLTIGNAYPGLCEVYPDLPECTKANDLLGLIIAALALLGIFLVLIVCIWINSKVEGGFIGLIVAIIITMAVAVGLLLSGVFDPLLLQMAGRGAGLITWRWSS